jgi:segregation and condensation protein A
MYTVFAHRVIHWCHMQFSLGEAFHGPLDLLLRLVEDRELSLTDISLSSVTEQFLAYVSAMDSRDPEIIADFLVVGTRLLVLKSTLLLPELCTVEDDNSQSLAEQLRLYQAFVQASKHVEHAWSGFARMGFHFEPPRRSNPPRMPQGLTGEALRASMCDLVRRLAPPKPLPQTTIDGTVSLRHKIDYIRSLFSRMKQASFHDMLIDKTNKTEIIVVLLAILELMKLQTVQVRQSQTFGDMSIIHSG